MDRTVWKTNIRKGGGNQRSKGQILDRSLVRTNCPISGSPWVCSEGKTGARQSSPGPRLFQRRRDLKPDLDAEAWRKGPNSGRTTTKSIFSEVRFSLMRNAFGREVATIVVRHSGESNCAASEWRRGWDSNPRYGFPYARFRGEYFQPLSHLSAVVASSILARVPTSGNPWFPRVC
jgi:hypothetical protein